MNMILPATLGRATRERPLHGFCPECSYTRRRLDLLPYGRPLKAARCSYVGSNGVYHAARHRLARVTRQPPTVGCRTRPL
jgi:hypothetical protein